MNSTQKSGKPRVVLADDHAELFDGLRSLLAPNFEVVGTAEDGQALISAARDLKPDLMVVDISMPRLSGIEAAKRLHKDDPNVKIVFLTMHQDPALVEYALDAGALGYVLKASARTELIQALQAALEGRPFVSTRLRKPST